VEVLACANHNFLLTERALLSALHRYGFRISRPDLQPTELFSAPNDWDYRSGNGGWEPHIKEVYETTHVVDAAGCSFTPLRPHPDDAWNLCSAKTKSGCWAIGIIARSVQEHAEHQLLQINEIERRHSVWFTIALQH